MLAAPHDDDDDPSAEIQADWAIDRVKTALFQIIQFYMSTLFRYKNIFISSNLFSISKQFCST